MSRVIAAMIAVKLSDPEDSMLIVGLIEAVSSSQSLCLMKGMQLKGCKDVSQLKTKIPEVTNE